MTAEEAAVFVNALQPKVAIPEHYGSGVGSKGDGKRFAKLVDPGIKVVFKL
jgi:L-ascorbate metabolism protein UlaG (beta-lactamase superfamily)